MRRSQVLFTLALGLFAAAPATGSAQDVELLSEIHGTPLPEGYRRTLAANPQAFQFSRGRAVRLRERIQALTGGAPAAGQVRSQAGINPMAILGPREGPVTGTYRIPVILGLFSDSPAGAIPFPKDMVQEAYFGHGAGTITAY